MEWQYGSERRMSVFFGKAKKGYVKNEYLQLRYLRYIFKIRT
jgi:hypothetical protein